MFPLWLWFRGGKGIATYFGMLGALNIYVLALTGAIWIAVFFIYRISAVAGMVSVICSCFIFKLMPYADHYYASGTRQLYVLMALTLLIIAKHHENIRELLEKRKPPPQKQ
jgi:glycerol-3-phosphate acyltransferase PlsY